MDWKGWRGEERESGESEGGRERGGIKRGGGETVGDEVWEVGAGQTSGGFLVSRKTAV